MKITINAVEVATELARRATINLLIYNGEYEVESDLVFIEDETEYYHPKPQKVFNDWYDYYLNILTAYQHEK